MQRSCGLAAVISRPFRRIAPASGARPPAIRLKSVVLPAPFGPIIPSASPCAEILERLHLLKRANTLAGVLTLLERKRLEMARALATNPHLLLLDEIAGGLTEGECLELIETIKQVHAAGMTIIWIEHVVHALVAVVSRLSVLNFGKKVAEGDPQEVMASAEVRQFYIGLLA